MIFNNYGEHELVWGLVDSGEAGFRYGFLTNQLVDVGISDADEMCDFWSEGGFDTLEIGPTFDLSDEALRSFESRGVKISDLIYCRNTLAADTSDRETVLEKLRQRIDWADRFGIPMVTTSAGFPGRSDNKQTYDRYEAIRPLPAAAIDEWVRVFTPLVELAEAKSVKLAFENCPLMQNWAIAPDLWASMFERIDSKQLGLVYDPSHLLWQMIDPYEPLEEFADRIFAIHAKDTQIDHERLARCGILSDFSWWSYRIPGRGQLDWSRFMGKLLDIGFDGPITIEHEDAGFSGSAKDVKAGILQGLAHLRHAEKQARSRRAKPRQLQES